MSRHWREIFIKRRGARLHAVTSAAACWEGEAALHPPVGLNGAGALTLCQKGPTADLMSQVADDLRGLKHLQTTQVCVAQAHDSEPLNQ